MKTELGRNLDALIGILEVDKFIRLQMAKELSKDESVTSLLVDLKERFALPVKEFYTVEQTTHSIVRFLGAISTLNTIEHELWKAVRLAKKEAEGKENSEKVLSQAAHT